MHDPALFRIYLDPDEIAPLGHTYEGYPYAWFRAGIVAPPHDLPYREADQRPPVKDLVRDLAGHRCVRCGHPYLVRSGLGEWSPCDALCTHGEPVRLPNGGGHLDLVGATVGWHVEDGLAVEASWRILTVHHLNGIKHDLRWWNLVALCQRCHLSVQTRVVMSRRYDRPHSEWFRPYVAGYYAATILGQDLSREDVDARLDELLDLELRQDALF